MAQEIADIRDVQFVLHEMLEISDLSKSKKFKGFNKKTVDMVLKEARTFAIKELLPLFKVGDEGCIFEKGKVTTPEGYKKAYDLFCEAGWLSLAENVEYGGQGMPRSLFLAASEYFCGANCSFTIYPTLSIGVGKIIEKIGSEEQKKIYLEKLFTGEWGGTMLLTEPQAGSDLGEIETEAELNDDGTYSITGQKIFISGGEQDLTENIVHATLARIKGGPKGSKGISLFLVPKYLVNDDGSLGEFNDVVCTGIEKKMGIHGASTCSLSLGSKGKCKGFLIGGEHKGLRAMFIMMNEERLNAGIQGLGSATASYVNAVNYAIDRIQGKNLLQLMDPNAPSVPIIKHPDIKRELISMKAYVEGMRALVYYVGLCLDKVEALEDGEKKAKYQGIVDFLTPIVKAYCSDKGHEICTKGMQVYGGYGYIREYPQEQLLRDCKIASLYEGTNGLQAMDLLGRKLSSNSGKTFINGVQEMQKILSKADECPELAEMKTAVKGVVEKVSHLAYKIASKAKSVEALETFSFATNFLEASGDMIMACMHLWRATVAQKALKDKNVKPKDALFYEGQLRTAEFFIYTILPVTEGKIKAIEGLCPAAIKIPEGAFLS